MPAEHALDYQSLVSVAGAFKQIVTDGFVSVINAVSTFGGLSMVDTIQMLVEANVVGPKLCNQRGLFSV